MTSLKSRRLFTLAAVVLVVTLAGVSVAQDPPGVAGIWTHGDTVLLFAFFGTCGDENVDFEQTLISRDGGKTWAKTGPRLYGQRLMFLLPEQGSGTSKGTGEDRNANMADELWLASEWSIESPGDPNLMLFDANSADWPHFEIDKEGGIAALVAIARDELDSNRFLAWVERDADIVEPDERFDPDSDPVYLNESRDGGRTWHRVERVKDVPKSAPGLRFFIDMPEQSGDWRIANINRPGSALEHRESDGKWHQVATLPLPIQQSCDDATTKD